jgi:hypothetical protein
MQQETTDLFAARFAPRYRSRLRMEGSASAIAKALKIDRFRLSGADQPHLMRSGRQPLRQDEVNRCHRHRSA